MKKKVGWEIISLRYFGSLILTQILSDPLSAISAKPSRIRILEIRIFLEDSLPNHIGL